jgi:uncharacterized protein (DUF736 family)
MPADDPTLTDRILAVLARRGVTRAMIEARVIQYPGRSRRISVDLDMPTFNRGVVAAMLELVDADGHTPQDPNLQ